MTSRRHFLQSTAAAAAGVLIKPSFTFRDAIRVGIMGTGDRGLAITKKLAVLPDISIAYVSDVDSRRMDEARAAVRDLTGNPPEAVTDFRRILDDPSVDALFIFAPDHWHAPAALLAMQAGKHVYVEKPGSHNAREGELLVEAASRYSKIVQMGNQRRSWPKIVEGMERLHAGDIGEVHYSRGWYANSRPSIGRGAPTAPPAWLDFEMWQGPAPREPFRENILHYNWHWFWNWGTAESGNNGVHALDLCRWGLGVDRPVRATSTGGRYFWDDDQETPDTQVITLAFEREKSITWEGLSSSRIGIDGRTFGATFHGEGGSLAIDGTGYRIYDAQAKLIEEVKGPDRFDIDVDHLANFRDAIIDGGKLHSPIAEGQKSTLLCHLGNIAYKTGRALACDPATGRIEGDAEAAALWGRTYAGGWDVAR
jgi:predicted dehydrogenase